MPNNDERAHYTTKSRAKTTGRPEIYLGRRVSGSRSKTAGFLTSATKETSDEMIAYTGEGHIMTIARTGAGKGVSATIPTLLTYEGSVIVFDPKGENVQVTCRRRREMGQRVVVIDPFGIYTDSTDSLNPMDLLQLEGADTETDAQMLAAMLSSANSFGRDPFWDNSARGLISGLIVHFATCGDEEKRTLNLLYDQLHCDNVTYGLAVILDTMGEKMNPFAHKEIAAFLQQPERETRPSVQATASSYLKSLAGGNVPNALSRSTFSLQEFVDAQPISIYIIIPPAKLSSHRGLLRLFIGTLLAAVLTRRSVPQAPTLFLLDEAAQLGNFPLFEEAITLCRGYGLKVWSFWQDLYQLKSNYPRSWPTLINNCEVRQLFGNLGTLSPEDWRVILGCNHTQSFDRLSNDEQLLGMPDGEVLVAQRLNYLYDREMKGLFDPNQRYSMSFTPERNENTDRSRE